jgi:hypothetical protein
MSALLVDAKADAASPGDLVPVVASLPVSFATAAQGERADVAAIEGGQGWPRLLTEALDQGPRGLVIVDPTPVLPDEVPDASTVPVVVDHRFSGNPALAGAADAFGRWPASAMIEVAAIVSDEGDLEATVVDALAALRRVGQPAARLTRLTWDQTGYYLSGSTTGGSPLLLSAHVTSGAAPSLRVRGLAHDRVVELRLPDPGTARPAVLVSTTKEGAVTAPTLWETSHRAAWRRLHAAVSGGEPTHDLAELRADLSVASQVLPAS